MFAKVFFILCFSLSFNYGESSRVIEKSSKIIEGLINKNAKPGSEVWLKSEISVTNWQRMVGNEVCGYGVKHPQSNHPFKIVLINSNNGLAKAVLAEGRRLDGLKKHVMDIYPYDCAAGNHGLRTRLIIDISESENHEFDRSVYEGFIFEKEYDSKIVCLQRFNETSDFHRSVICNHHVITPSTPFNVDQFGCVYNTRVLDFNLASERDINFQVLAELCNNQGVTTPVEVNIKVLCNHLSWIDNNLRLHGVDSDDNKGVKIMDGAKLDLCDESCIPVFVSTSLHLKLSPPFQGEMDSSYSLQTFYKLCGVLIDVLDLLPTKSESNSWTRNLPTNEKEFENVYPEFNFNGISTFSEIFLDQSVARFTDFPFSVSWALQRLKYPNDDEDELEHVMCFASEFDSRQFVKFSISVHKCQLLFRLYHDDSMSERKSWRGESTQMSEWNWNLAEVCDGEWHDYVISMDSNEILLHLDGILLDKISFDERLFRDVSSAILPEVQKFYVGSCQHGESKEMKGFLKGSLSSLHVTLNSTPADANMAECLRSFDDKLQLNFEKKNPESSGGDVDENFNVTETSRSKKITINTKDIGTMERLVSRVQLIKSPLPYIPWQRNVLVQTSIECQDGRTFKSETFLHSIQKVVNGSDTSAEESTFNNLVENVNLNLSRAVAFKKEDYKKGVRFMKDLKISATEEMNWKELILLDACLVQFNSKLDKNKDGMRGFEALASKQHLIVAIYDFGISFTGLGRLEDYEKLLSSLIFETWESKKRTLSVRCSFRGKQTKNLSLMLDVIHEDYGSVKGHEVPHRIMSNKVIHPAMFDNLQLIAKPFPVSFKYNTADDSGAGVALVMIVCIGFIVLLIVLGIVRIRSLQIGDDPKSQAEDPEFNITLNPIHPDNITKSEDLQKSNEKLNADCEDSEDDSFCVSDERQKDWKNSVVLL